MLQTLIILMSKVKTRHFGNRNIYASVSKQHIYLQMFHKLVFVKQNFKQVFAGFFISNINSFLESCTAKVFVISQFC